MIKYVVVQPFRLLVGVLALTFAAGSASALDPIAFGHELYKENCAVCHGAAGAGDGEIGNLLAVRPKNLTLISKNNNNIFPFSEVYQAINRQRTITGHGTSEMPVWGKQFMASALPKEIHPGVRAEEVVQGRILALVYFIQTIQEN